MTCALSDLSVCLQKAWACGGYVPLAELLSHILCTTTCSALLLSKFPDMWKLLLSRIFHWHLGAKHSPPLGPPPHFAKSCLSVTCVLRIQRDARKSLNLVDPCPLENTQQTDLVFVSCEGSEFGSYLLHQKHYRQQKISRNYFPITETEFRIFELHKHADTEIRIIRINFCICNSWCGSFESISASVIFWVDTGFQN